MKQINLLYEPTPQKLKIGMIIKQTKLYIKSGSNVTCLLKVTVVCRFCFLLVTLVLCFCVHGLSKCCHWSNISVTFIRSSLLLGMITHFSLVFMF